MSDLEQMHNDLQSMQDEQTEMLNSSDGLGSVIDMEIASVEQEGDNFKVNYDCYGVDGYYECTNDSQNVALSSMR